MTAWDGLAGNLRLLPGREAPHNLVRRRPAALARVLSQRPADAWPDLVAAVFSLCGHAQRNTARRAVAAARGFPAMPGQAENSLLRWHTARDHVRRILLDWEAPDLQARSAAERALSSCPLFKGADCAEALRLLSSWLASDLLGARPDRWLRDLEIGGEPFLENWTAVEEGPAAASLRAVRSRAQPLTLPLVPVGLHCDEQAQLTLAAQLSGAAELSDEQAIAPMATAGFETGAWTRHRDAGQTTVHNAWMRWAYRLIDLARLAVDEADRWLCCGAATTGDGEGIAWTETSRGLLVHWVRLEGGKVSRFRVISPTDWNFHPQGPVARALSRVGEADARCLAAAFDPCVPLQLASEEPAHA